MPAHVLSASLRRLERHVRARHGPGWLSEAVTPMLELLEHPHLPACSVPVEHPIVEQCVRHAAGQVVAELPEGWRLAILEVPGLGLTHGAGVIAARAVGFVWLENLARGIVIVVDPAGQDVDVFSITVALASGPEATP